jgi:hypothetical protein
MIFRRVIGDHLKEVTLNGRLISIFLEMDGKKKLGAIAQDTRLNWSDLRDAVSRLSKLQLIEQVANDSAVIDDEFLNFLRLQLAKAIGPLSTILVEDSIQAAGYSSKRFPVGRAGELVETLAQEIQREAKRHQFKNDMYRMIRQKGYVLPLL